MIVGVIFCCFLGGAFLAWFALRKRITRLSENLKDSRKAIKYFQEQPQRDSVYWKEKETAAVKEALEQERQRIAAELNDDLLQRLAATKLQLEAMQIRHSMAPDAENQMNLIQSELSRVMESARPLIWQLSLPDLEQKTLSRLLRDSCEQLDASISRSINFRVSGLDREWNLDDDAKLVMFRMVQEAVQNAIAHADAWHIHVGVDWWREGLEIMVQDDGTGIIHSHKKEGFSLSKLATRARQIGASVWYEDNRPRGTRVRMKLPIPPGKSTVK